MNYVKYEDFNNMDMRLGLIKFVEPVEGTDKLLRFEIDFGPKVEQVITCDGECEKKEGEETRCEIHCESVKPTESKLPFNKEEYAGRDIRQIVSGIREYWPQYEKLVGNYGLYILNLEPRKIRGVMSYGMLMAVDGVDGNPVFLGPQGDIEPGAKVR